MSMIIGLTGVRGTGKSLIANHLQERHGFLDIHAFAPGKTATEAYFIHLGADPETAHRMTYGDLRDTPSSILPLDPEKPGQHHIPRFFMEMFGNFCGTVLGPEWTAEPEIRRARSLYPERPLLIQSVVYEERVIRAHGGLVIRVDREGCEGKGLKTDEFVKKIIPDEVFLNDHPSIEEMLAAFEARFLEPVQAPSP